MATVYRLIKSNKTIVVKKTKTEELIGDRSLRQNYDPHDILTEKITINCYHITKTET